MIALNGEIDALDNKVSGKTQLELYAAVQDLLLDRLVWFLRNVDLKQGLETDRRALSRGHRAGCRGARWRAVEAGVAARDARVAELDEGRRAGGAGAPHRQPAGAQGGARHRAGGGSRQASRWREVTATYFATEAFFQLDRVAGAVPGIVVADYFDRLALDRALDSIGDAERRLTAAMVGNGHAGAGAVEEWVRPRQAEVERIRSAIHEIAGSGLTLSKLSVAASLLGDLARE